MKKYEQIILDLKLQIQEKQLPQGAKLPSIRQLSTQYQCNKDTVSKALLELKYQNMIYAKHKSGYYVLGEWHASQEAASEWIDFSNAMPDARLFPYEDFRQCLNQAIRTKEAQLFTYHVNHQGLETLLASLQKYLTASQIYTNQDNLVVTTGIQQALYLLTQLPFPNGKEAILLEQPTYHLMNQLVRAEQLPYYTIERTEQGVNLTELETLFKTKAIKFFYTIPRFHNPLGLSYTTQQKEKIVQLAEQYDVYLVEDDYLGDFDQHQRHLPFHYYDYHQRVIYLKSFSKIIFPALRLGCCLLPTALVAPFTAKKMLIDYDTNLLSQKALSLYIDSGMFERHRQFLAQSYQKKATVLNQTLQALYLRQDGRQLFDTKVAFELQETTDIQQLKAILAQHKIRVSFLEGNYLQMPRCKRVQLDVRNMALDTIATNVTTCLALLQPYLQ